MKVNSHCQPTWLVCVRPSRTISLTLILQPPFLPINTYHNGGLRLSHLTEGWQRLSWSFRTPHGAPGGMRAFKGVLVGMRAWSPRPRAPSCAMFWGGSAVGPPHVRGMSAEVQFRQIRRYLAPPRGAGPGRALWGGGGCAFGSARLPWCSGRCAVPWNNINIKSISNHAAPETCLPRNMFPNK